MKVKIVVLIIIFILVVISIKNYNKILNPTKNYQKGTVDYEEIRLQIALNYQNFLDSTKLNYYGLNQYISPKDEKYTIRELKGPNQEEAAIIYYNEADTTLTIMSKNYSPNSISDRPYDEYTKNYYKINAFGNVIDSLKLMKDEISDNYFGYLINDDSYYTWLIDGNKTKYLCKKINKDFLMTKEQVNEKFRLLYEKSSIATMHTVVIHNKNNPSYPSVYIPVFFVENKWVMLFGSDLDIGLNDSDKYTIKVPNNYKELPNLIENQKTIWTNKNKHISLDYFHRKEYAEEFRSNPLSPITMYKHAKWGGEAYLHLNLKKKKIPFIIWWSKIISEDSINYSPIPFKYYTHENLNFGIINIYDQIFLIKLN